MNTLTKSNLTGPRGNALHLSRSRLSPGQWQKVRAGLPLLPPEEQREYSFRLG